MSFIGTTEIAVVGINLGNAYRTYRDPNATAQ